VGNIGQCPYTIDNLTDGTSDLYIRFWITINADYVENIDGRGGWRTFFEWKTEEYASGDGFRFISYICLDESSNPPYWHWQGDANPSSPLWEIDNREVPVPIGQWFLTEFYWHWSEGPDGRALWKVNNQVISDHFGPTTRNSHPNDFHIQMPLDEKSDFQGGTLEVYSLSGALVDRLPRGSDGYLWRTRQVPSGVYFVTPVGAPTNKGQKLVLIR